MLTNEQIYLLGALKKKLRSDEVTARIASASQGRTQPTQEEVDVLIDGLIGAGYVRPITGAPAAHQRFEITDGGRAALTNHIRHVLEQDSLAAARGH